MLLKNKEFDRVTLLLRKGDLAKLREMARQRGYIVRMGPNVGEPSVAGLVKEIIDRQMEDAAVDLAAALSQEPAQQAMWLKRAIDTLQPQVDELKAQVEALVADLERRGQAERKPEVAVDVGVGESAEARE